jgi:hypothetical protein
VTPRCQKQTGVQGPRPTAAPHTDTVKDAIRPKAHTDQREPPAALLSCPWGEAGQCHFGRLRGAATATIALQTSRLFQPKLSDWPIGVDRGRHQGWSGVGGESDQAAPAGRSSAVPVSGRTHDPGPTGPGAPQQEVWGAETKKALPGQRLSCLGAWTAAPELVPRRGLEPPRAFAH